MGFGSSKNKSRKNEDVILDHPLNHVNTFLYNVCPSICKIYYRNKLGTGFLIKVYLKDISLYSIMTNEHIITEEMVKCQDEIQVYYDNEKQRIKIVLNENERFIQNFKDIGIDCTIVEILLSDNISNNYFLLPNLDYSKDNYKDLNNKTISIVQYPDGEQLSHSEGPIINIDKYELTYKASTMCGSSGSPIFLGNIDKVIGIHKSSKVTSNKKEKENYGDFIFPIIKKLGNINSKNQINTNNFSNFNFNYGNNKYYNNNYKRPTKVNYTKIKGTKSDIGDYYRKDSFVENILINECEIPRDLLNLRETETNWGGKEKRGGFDYIPPHGWIGIGLNVLGKYDRGNDDWLTDNYSDDGWAVAYHGTNGRNLKSILIDGFKIGPSQFHKNTADFFHKGKKVGVGIYLNPDPKVMEEHARGKTIEVNRKKYMTALMLRVKPDKIRSPLSFKDLWILNPTSDEIRPYRILIKKA